VVRECVCVWCLCVCARVCGAFVCVCVCVLCDARVGVFVCVCVYERKCVRDGAKCLTGSVMNFTRPQIFLKQKNQHDRDRRGLVARTTNDRNVYHALVAKTEGPAKLAKSSLYVTITADLP